MSSVTPIRGGGGQPPSEPPQGPPAEDLDELTGYSGSIQGTPLDEAIDEQRSLIFDAQAIIDTAAKALQDADGEGAPLYSRALQSASRLLNDVAGALEAGVLEDRALAIARSKVAS